MSSEAATLAVVRPHAMTRHAAVPRVSAMPAASFEDFVAAWDERLMSTAYLLTRDHHLAQDLVQTTYSKVWPRWGRITGEPEHYVRRVMVNTYTSWWRRKWRGEHPTDEVPEEHIRGSQDRVEDRLSLAAALGRLSVRQRAALVLRFYEDYSEADTALALGCSPGTVKSLTSRALAKLRQDPALAERNASTREEGA